MKTIDFYFDFISPYAYLAFERLPAALEGISHQVRYKPILFAALLKHHGQLGPAEIPAKREWTYRQMQWLAHSLNVPLQTPATHPFNPLGVMRLALACPRADVLDGLPNRYQCEQIFRAVWTTGADAAAPDTLQALADRLSPAQDPADDAVKAKLKNLTDEAIEAGVFGVPTMAVDGKLFWGHDSLPMLRAYLQGDAWFDSTAWDVAATVPAGAQRRVAPS